jgi:hypothetical protein
VRRGYRRCVLLLTPVVAASLTLGGVPTAEASSHRVLWGAFVPPGGAATNQAAFSAQERQIGRHYDVDHHYRRFGQEDVITKIEQWDKRNGRLSLVHISLPMPCDSSGHCRPATHLIWQRILRGDFDTWLDRQAMLLDKFTADGTPFYLGFQHEAERLAPWFGSASDYVAAFAHVRTQIESHLHHKPGSGRVSYVWSPIQQIFRNPAQAAQWYPGDQVTNVVGPTAYNMACTTLTGQPALPGCGKQWQSFATLMSAGYQFAVSHGKRFWAVETGTAEDPANKNRKAQWIAEMANTAEQWASLDAILWFSGGRYAAAWKINTGSPSLQAYIAVGHRPSFGG